MCRETEPTHFRDNAGVSKLFFYTYNRYTEATFIPQIHGSGVTNQFKEGFFRWHLKV